MACSSPEAPDAGFATPAAAVISLAIAVIASAVTALSIADLRSERTDLERTQADYALSGAQAHAVMMLLASSNAGASQWRVALGNSDAEVIAEPETPKLGLAAPAALADDALRRLQTKDASAARARLQDLAGEPDQTAGKIAVIDPSPVWRLCARSVFSPYGAATKLPQGSWSPLAAGGGGRTGALWRIRIAGPDGWVDDRIVRFTGSLQRPVAVVARSFGRGSELGEACQNVLAAAAPR